MKAIWRDARLMCVLAAALLATATALAQTSNTAVPGASGPAPSAASAPAASSGLPASLPLRRDKADTDTGGPGLVMGTLLFVGLLAVGAALVLRRRSGAGLPPAWRERLFPKGADTLARTSSQPLTAQASVHVVVWHGEELLLGCTAQSVTLLARHPVAPSADAQAGGAAP